MQWKNTGKRSQLSIEFIVMVGIAMTLLLLLMLLGNDLLKNTQESQKYTALRDYGYVLQSEILLAAKAEPGYQRVFFVPHKIDGFDYILESTPKSFSIKYKKHVFNFFLPEIDGDIKKGYNMVTTNSTAIIIKQV